MRLPQIRLRSWMILVLLSSLVMGAITQASKMQPINFVDLRERFIVLLPFLILVALKLGLVVASRWRRANVDDQRPIEGSPSDASSP